MRIKLGMILGVATALALAHPAKADFVVCNQTTSGALMVAAAYYYESGQDSWSRSQGFWTIGQGECRTTLTNLSSGVSLYLFAWSFSNESLTWSGGTNYSSGARNFCVNGHKSPFLYKADDAMPTCSDSADSVARTFRYAGTADRDGDLTYDVQD